MLLGFITNKSGQIVIHMFEFFGITLNQVYLDIYSSTFVVKLASFRSTCLMLAEVYFVKALDLL